MSLLFYVLHEGFEEEGAAVDEVPAEIVGIEKAEAYFLKECLIDKQEQSIECSRRQEVHDLFFYLSVPKLLLSVYFTSMRSYLCLHFLLDILRP